ncbi:MAG TPA: hypothetical protein VNJ01_17755 [Bacteriovoracaceae bacterium]|nr:hypothetical protein [Bacteriovoracaceae bacterium]
MPEFVEKIRNQEALAAIDLGSNALRAIIVRKNENGIEVVKNFREPLRLGEDVFETGMISEEKMELTEEAFIKLLHAFAEFNVSNTKALATSAMRDSKNGSELIERIYQSTGIRIETIKGREEARLILGAVRGQVPLKKKLVILMDIGGGSTELTIVKNEMILAVHSFNIGTVRLLKYKSQDELEKQIARQMEKMMEFIRGFIKKKKPDLFIGTGGNLRRIGKIRKKILGKSSSEEALYAEVAHMEESILSMSYVDRIRRLELDQNRADVILPAIMLARKLMSELKVNRINLPKVGLKEGIILSMLDTVPKRFILKD